MQRFLSFVLVGSLLLSSCSAYSQTSLRDRANQLKGNSTNPSNPTSNKNLSTSDVTSGLKEALRIGATNATKNLSITDGFFRNAAVKILLPPEAQVVEQTLRSVGMGSLVDEAILKLNRAAEDATKKAGPIFISAITAMTIQDGMSILSGGQDAATQYLKRVTTAQLANEFRPIIQSSLGSVGADRIWNTVFDNYNKMPLVKNKVNPNLVDYVTGKALDGVFYSIAQEELKIRTDPAAQVNQLLKNVFGK